MVILVGSTEAHSGNEWIEIAHDADFQEKIPMPVALANPKVELKRLRNAAQGFSCREVTH